MASIGRLVCKTSAVTVATAGTPVAAFSAPYPKVAKVYFRADPGNSGNIFVGDDNVDNSGPALLLLDAGELGSLEGGQGSTGGSLLLSLEDIFVDASSNGDSVYVSYIEVV